MNLGRRHARQHETAGFQKNALDSSVFWEYKPQQQVMTVDGFPGVVTAVWDGPVAGYEEYQVTLDNGLGGGSYTASQLSPLAGTTASHDHEATGLHLASDDYEELHDILWERPPIERMTFSASHTAARSDFDFQHQEVDTGGTKFPRRVDMTAHHPETGEEAGKARYFPPKRRGGPISIDEVKGHKPGAASALLDEIESRHPGSSTKFLWEVKRNNNNPDVTGHAHERAGQPTDWDTHYPNVAPTIHRGLSLRLPSYSARTVNSSGATKDEHLAEIHAAMPTGPNVGTHWTENEHAARLFAHNAVSDHRTDIPVVLHAATPAQKDLESRPAHLYRGGVFPYGDPHSSENEIPVRRGREVAVTGISWKPDAPHPDADEDGWMHHTYPEPKEHTAARSEFEGHDLAVDAELPDEVHRGFSLRLSPEDHEALHDESRPAHERAQILMSHYHDMHERNRDGQNLGRHWSTSPDVARSFSKQKKYNASLYDFKALEPTSTQVVFHAQTPSVKSMISSPRTRDKYTILPHSYGEQEVPVRRNTTLNINGVSWARNEPDSEMTRHDFEQPLRMKAALEDLTDEDTQEAEPELPPCAYCGSDQMQIAGDTGRAQQAKCQVCGGMMSAPYGLQFKPELIGDPSNHPKDDPDPASGGVPGAANMRVPVKRMNDSDYTASLHEAGRYEYSSPTGWHYDTSISGKVKMTSPEGESHDVWTHGMGIKQFRHQDDMPTPLYHGTRREIPEGEQIEPGHPGNFVKRMKHVYMADDPEEAAKYAGPYGHVYQVKPTGLYGHRSDAKGQNWATEDPVDIVGIHRGPTHMRTEGIAHTAKTVSWDEIGSMHPHVYGDAEIHGEDAEGGDGPGIGFAANYLAHERPGHQDAEDSSVHDLEFHPMRVHPRHIDFNPSGANDQRVKNAREGYKNSPDSVPPLVLVKRHNVYQVADGHHRAEAAASLNKSVRAYVAHSPYPDEPFADGEKGPFHGAEPLPREVQDENNLHAHMQNEHGYAEEQLAGKSDKDVARFHDQKHFDCPAEFRAKMGSLHTAETLDLYHRTTPESAAAIYRDRKMHSKENTGDTFWSNRRDSDNSSGYGEGVVHVRVPKHLAEIDDEFPDGEEHYRIHHNDLKPHHFVEGMLKEALRDNEFRFEFTAAWSDVRAKARRIRSEGKVNIVVATNEGVGGEVKGDHHVYETVLTYVPGTYKVGSWECGCKWAAYAWGRSPAYRRFEGRMCSHALAMQFEAQARGMFGRTVEPSAERPKWLRHHTPVVTQYERDSGENLTRRAVPPGNMRRTYEGAAGGAPDPLELQQLVDKVREEDRLKHQDDNTYAENYRPLKHSDLHPEEHSGWKFQRNTDTHWTPFDQEPGLSDAEVAATRPTDANHGPVPLTQYRHPSGREPLHLDEHGNSWRRNYAWESPEHKYPKFQGWSGPHSASETVDTHPTWSISHDEQGNQRNHMRTMRERMTMTQVLPGESHEEIALRRNRDMNSGGWNVISSLDADGVYATDHGLDLVHPPVYAYVIAELQDPVEAMQFMASLGMSHSAARAVVKDVSAERVTGELHFEASLRLMAEEGHGKDEKKRCPDCGSMIAINDEKCPHCHHVFSAHERHHGAKAPAEGDLMSRGMVIGDNWDHDSVRRVMKGEATPHDLLRHIDKSDIGDFWYAHHPDRSHEDNIFGAKDFARTETSEHPAQDLDRDRPIGETGVVLVGHKPESWNPEDNPDHGLMGNSYIPHSADVPLHKIHYQDHHGDWHSTDATGHSVHVVGGGYDHAVHQGAKKDPESPTVAGVALKAADTGRILMLQRGLEDEKDPARGTWEVPGGHREDGDRTSLDTAIREWEEETGQPFPEGGVVHHTWTSPNGIYQGHVVVIPEERAVEFHNGRSVVNPDNPDGDQHEQAAWWDVDHARKNPALREELKTGTPWKEIKAAGNAKTASAESSEPGAHEGFDAWRERLWGGLREHGTPIPPAQHLYRSISDGEMDAAKENGEFRDRFGQHLYVSDDPDRMAGGAYGAKGGGHIIQINPSKVEVASRPSQYIRGLEEKAVPSVPLHAVTRSWSWSPEHQDHMPSDHFHHTAATADPLYGLEEASPLSPPQHSNSTNPASTGWATTQDPHSWDDPENNATNLGALPGDGFLGSLHDEPEAALPSTDGAESELDNERQDASLGQYDENDAEMTPNTTLASAGSAQDIVARFQATAAAASLGGGEGGHHAAQQANNKDIANAAKEFLSKQALKDFNYAEQQELINEGARDKIMARNSDVLNIQDTHYAALEAALAAEDALEDSAELFA